MEVYLNDEFILIYIKSKFEQGLISIYLCKLFVNVNYLLV